jgi:hypothetical protein
MPGSIIQTTHCVPWQLATGSDAGCSILDLLVRFLAPELGSRIHGSSSIRRPSLSLDVGLPP